MNITFSCSHFGPCDHCFRVFENVAGKQIDTVDEVEAAHNNNGRLVKTVPCERPLLVGSCGYKMIKMVDRSSLFFVSPTTEELNVVAPFVEELIRRKVFVLKTVRRPDMEAVREKCRKSFYHPDGSLKNSRFERDNLSPSKMAEAGFRFVGDSDREGDIVACYYHCRHRIFKWEDSDDPVSEHLRFFGPLCIEQKEHEVPVLSTESGRDVTGETFNVIVSKKKSHGESYHRVTLVTHAGYLLKRTSFLSVVRVINSVRLDQTQAALKSKQLWCQIDREYSSLHQLSLKLEHFSAMLQEFRHFRQIYIALLNNYKSSLDSGDTADISSVLSVLSSGTVEQEVGQTVECLSANAVTKIFASLLDIFPVDIQECAAQAITSVASDNVAKFAHGFSDRFFVDESLNDVISKGRLVTVLSEGDLVSGSSDENLMELLERGADLTDVLIRISEKIDELLSPFVDEKE